MPSWIAFVWRSVLPEQTTKKSVYPSTPRRSSSAMPIAFLSAARSAIARARLAGSVMSCCCVSDRGSVIRCPSRIGGRLTVEALVLDVRGDGVRHEVAHRQAGAGPAADQRAGDVEPRHVEEAHALSRPREIGEPLGDVGAADALALGDADPREGENPLRVAPRGQRERHVAAHDERQLVVAAQRTQQVDGVRRPLAVGVRARDAEAVVVRDRRLAHGDAVLHARIGLDRLVRSDRDGHQQHAVEPELQERLLRADQMSEMRRVERAAEQADLGHPYGRTWPVPSTRYLNVHSSRSPIGPRACSFWVEFPISAPIPNSPPSVKRVDALTYTQAASTPSWNARAASTDPVTIASECPDPNASM